MFNIKKTDKNVLTVYIDVGRRMSSWEQYFLLRSDEHHDNPHCNQKMEEAHLKDAIKRKAGVISGGDNFCAMQGKYDPRSNKDAVRPEHQVNDYLDALVRTNADFLAPYAKNIINMSKGNHETAILKRHETDLTQRLVSVLNDRTGSNIQSLGYTGWIIFRFNFGSKQFYSKVLYYNHGSGGGAPVTEGMIKSNRQRVTFNADIMMHGHIHRSWVQEYMKYEVTNSGTLKKKRGLYIQIPGYKEAYGDGESGFETECGLGPRPIGAYWLRFFWNQRIKDVDFEAIKAN